MAVALIALVASCGGSGKDDSTGSVSEKQASDVARQYFLTTFGVLSGKTSPQELINLYAPECRDNVDAKSIAGTLLLARAFLPGLDEINVEDVDLGELKYETNDKGILVSPVDPSAARVKVDGKFVDIAEYFKSVGLPDDASSTTDSTNEPILIVKRDGKALIGDCTGLSDYRVDTPGSSGSPGFSATVTFQPAQSTGPGSSRSAAMKLGAPATVEDTWKITVLDVNEDAWDVVNAPKSFNDPPAADERIVLIRVGVENVSTDDQPQHIGDFEFSLTGSHNELYSSYDQDHSCFAPDSLDAQLFPKGKAQGDLCFRIPRDETNLLLVWNSFSTGQTYFKLD